MTPPCPPTGATIRRKQSVLLSTISFTMLIFSVSSCATNSNASFILSKVHSKAFIFPEGVFIFFPCSSLQGGEAFQQIGSAFHLLQVFSGWRFLLPVTLYSCTLFFFSQLPNLSQENCSHIPRRYGSFSIIFNILPRYEFFSTTCLHCTYVCGSCPSACKCLLKHF